MGLLASAIRVGNLARNALQINLSTAQCRPVELVPGEQSKRPQKL